MKKQVTHKLSLVLSSVVVLMATACTSSDIGDVYKGPVVDAKENPLSGLNPSASFSWSTIQSSHVTIEVDDHFDNQYNYYVRLYAENPAAQNKPNALFTGVARGNNPATCEVDLPSSASDIYVEVTDPQGYVMTYGYAAPQAGAQVTLPCVVGEPAVGATKMDVMQTRVSADFELPDAVAMPEMDWSVPADAEVLPDNDKWNKSAEYTVPANTTLTLSGNRSYSAAWKGTTRIVVEGTLDIQGYNLTLAQGAQLYVKDGGKVIGNTITLNAGSILASEKGGELQLSQVCSNGATYFYTAGTAYIKDQINFNNADANIYVAPTGQIIGAAKNDAELEDMTYTMAFTAIQSQLYIDADVDNSGQFWCASITNVNNSAEIVVAANAHMYVVGAVNMQCSLYNAGLFTANSFDGGRTHTCAIYNACTMIVKKSITDINRMYIKDGTLSGGVSVDENNNLVFAPIPLYTVTDNWDTQIDMLNGSFMDLQDVNIHKLTISGVGGSTSLARVHGNITCSKLLKFHQALVAEYDENKVVTVGNGSKVQVNGGASYASLGQTAMDLETCTGNIPTRVEDDDDDIVQPDPFVGSVMSEYTINFEDQWPALGDYDVNDVVLHVDQITTEQSADKVKKATFTIHLLAVGAGYTLGAGVQLDNVTNGDIASVEYELLGQAGMSDRDKGQFTFGSNGAENGASSELAILPLFYDAHEVYLHKMVATAADHHPLNTGSSHDAGAGFTIKVTFADGADVAPEDLMSSALNFFIYRPADEAAQGGKRVEVHLKGYKPTRNVVEHYFGTANDNSSGNNYYVTADGFPWGIIVTDVNHQAWDWPRESHIITEQYGHFAQWVNSNGTNYANWMVQ